MICKESNLPTYVYGALFMIYQKVVVTLFIAKLPLILE